jgi:hypothetical protein
VIVVDLHHAGLGSKLGIQNDIECENLLFNLALGTRPAKRVSRLNLKALKKHLLLVFVPGYAKWL